MNAWVKLALVVLVSLPQIGFSAESSTSELDRLKMAKRFGMGVSAGGPLAVLGFEIDMNLSPEVSLSGGIGTGLDYSTFMAKLRYFLPGEWVSPYFAVGVARWWTTGTRETNLAPSVLTHSFLGGVSNYQNGFSVFMVYPAIGVQIMHPLGIAFFAEAEYLFQLFNFASGTYAGLGVHWYF